MFFSCNKTLIDEYFAKVQLYKKKNKHCIIFPETFEVEMPTPSNKNEQGAPTLHFTPQNR